MSCMVDAFLLRLLRLFAAELFLYLRRQMTQVLIMLAGDAMQVYRARDPKSEKEERKASREKSQET